MPPAETGDAAHNPRALQAILTQAAPPDLELSFRPMFGGIMAYAEGRVFASLSDVGLALKLSGEARDALLALPGAKPLQYEPGAPVSTTYVVAPAATLADPAALRPWVARAAAGLRAKPKTS